MGIFNKKKFSTSFILHPLPKTSLFLSFSRALKFNKRKELKEIFRYLNINIKKNFFEGYFYRNI